ncbi:hypothetical protein SISSUDRAFT_1066376 [Sistotremastrum suecicum HHB10207 ss-3]|uniref:Uncharacterized protein n=1 Tax=Sistotremastrum suecicum HHB10207 ss-3 TaxID=1314776 RepID=A0A165YE01_9AGAM|nr:hypothetical protein SISSUDRAFT_1066376 [Sistotremastrum suecicum HHB10207 ss-3]
MSAVLGGFEGTSRYGSFVLSRGAPAAHTSPSTTRVISLETPVSRVRSPAALSANTAVAIPPPAATIEPTHAPTMPSTAVFESLPIVLPQIPRPIPVKPVTATVSPAFFEHDLRSDVLNLESYSEEDIQSILEDLLMLQKAGSINFSERKPKHFEVEWPSGPHETIGNCVQSSLFGNCQAASRDFNPALPSGVAPLGSISVNFLGGKTLQPDGGLLGWIEDQTVDPSPCLFIEVAVTQTYSEVIIKCAQLLAKREGQRSPNLVIVVKTDLDGKEGRCTHAWVEMWGVWTSEPVEDFVDVETWSRRVRLPKSEKEAEESEALAKAKKAKAKKAKAKKTKKTGKPGPSAKDDKREWVHVSHKAMVNKLVFRKNQPDTPPSPPPPPSPEQDADSTTEWDYDVGSKGLAVKERRQGTYETVRFYYEEEEKAGAESKKVGAENKEAVAEDEAADAEDEAADAEDEAADAEDEEPAKRKFWEVKLVLLESRQFIEHGQKLTGPTHELDICCGDAMGWYRLDSSPPGYKKNAWEEAMSTRWTYLSTEDLYKALLSGVITDKHIALGKRKMAEHLTTPKTELQRPPKVPRKA